MASSPNHRNVDPFYAGRTGGGSSRRSPIGNGEIWLCVMGGALSLVSTAVLGMHCRRKCRAPQVYCRATSVGGIDKGVDKMTENGVRGKLKLLIFVAMTPYPSWNSSDMHVFYGTSSTPPCVISIHALRLAQERKSCFFTGDCFRGTLLRSPVFT